MTHSTFIYLFNPGDSRSDDGEEQYYSNSGMKSFSDKSLMKTKVKKFGIGSLNEFLTRYNLNIKFGCKKLGLNENSIVFFSPMGDSGFHCFVKTPEGIKYFACIQYGE